MLAKKVLAFLIAAILGAEGSKNVTSGNSNVEYNLRNSHIFFTDADIDKANWYRHELLSSLETYHTLLNVTELSNECKIGVENFLNGIENSELWALKMLDSTAKMPSGILRGNLNQYGDFDQCLEVGKYCLAEINLDEFWKENTAFAYLKGMVHSDFMITGTFNDPSHRVPNFSTIKWGFCIPTSCTSNDLGVALLSNRILSQVRPELCQVTGDQRDSDAWNRFVVVSLFALLLAAVLSSTVLDSIVKTNSENVWSSIIQSFSLKRNITELRTIKQDSIDVIDGIRSLSAFALIMCHKAMSQSFGPYTNTQELSNHLGKPWSIIGRTATVYTDSFIFLSGFLTATNMIGSLEKYNAIHFKAKLIKRIFRILPSMMFVILFCTYILPHISNGPLWPVVINHHANLCKQNYWRNMLFIHNYFSFEDMCLTHTHQIGIDMQLFLITPIFVWLLWSKRAAGYILLILLAVISTFLRFDVTHKKELSYVVYFGISVSKMFDTADYSYILPTHRATIYIFGICFAFILKDGVFRSFYKNKFSTITYLLYGVGSGFYASIGPYQMGSKEYHYNVNDAAAFAAFSPIFWGIALAWTIHAAKFQYGGWFTNILSFWGFKYFAKITYSFYLIQFPILLMNVGRKRYSSEYEPLAFLEIVETTWIICGSIILTLLVEMPFRNLHHVIFTSDNSKQNCCKQNLAIKIVQQESDFCKKTV